MNVLVAGQGRFADMLAASLATPAIQPMRLEVPTTELEQICSPILVAHTWNSPDADGTWQELARKARQPLLRILWEGDELQIGPWLQPDSQRGCALCLEQRLAWNALDRAEYSAHRSEHLQASQAGADRPGPGPDALALLMSLIESEAARYQRGLSPRTEGAVYILSVRTLTGRLHRFLPDPACPFCGQAVPDSRERVAQLERFIPKPNPFTFRRTGGTPDLERLRSQFVDVRTGVIHNEVDHPYNRFFPVSEAKLVLPFRQEREPGIGRELTRHSAHLVAILEALERHAGMRPLAKRTTVTGSYHQLAADALDPRELILYTEDQVSRHKRVLAAFDPDNPIRWVWGYSFQRGGPVLVPEQAAYYGLGPEHGPFHLVESSNGCALGSCLEEAILHGLFEVLERDALMMAWYARLPVPAIDLGTSESCSTALLLDRAAEHGIRVEAFDTTTEFGIPSVWARAAVTTAVGEVTASASGCHLNPERAVQGALTEVLYAVPHLIDVMTANPAGMEQLAAQPDLIRTHQDHLYAGAWPGSSHRFSFLDRNRRFPIRERFAAWYSYRATDNLVDDLDDAVNRVLAEGLDVIVVDQSPPELTAAGLSAVKVLVPGTLPLTAGHHLRRVEGATRLFTVPQRLGYPPLPNVHELNALPHPFA